MNDRFAAAVDDMKRTMNDMKDMADGRTEAGDSCLDGDCDREMFELRHPRNPESKIPRHKDAPEVEVCCILHGIQATR